MNDLELAYDGPIATLRLNRPEQRNAVSFRMYQALPELLGTVAADPAVRVLVLRGAGTAAFSAGADIKEFQTVRAGGEGARRYNAAVAAAETALVDLQIPTIAMIHGYCIGGGCGLAMACDLRLADTEARLGITPARLGLVYGLESIKRLVDLAGPATAKYLLYSGRHLRAERALARGLLDEVHPVEDLERLTLDLAREITTRAPLSIRGTKELVGRVLAGQSHDDDHTRAVRNTSFDSEDYAEGVRAFLEKRSPSFQGR